jgi:hypothetical protein
VHRRFQLVIALGACVALFATAQADRLFMVPTGTKVHLGTVRFETMFEQAKSGSRRDSVATAVGQSFDFELVSDRMGSRRGGGTFDFSYNFAFPVPDVSPGISVGMRDVLNRTVDGRGLYAAATFKYGQMDPFNSNSPAEVTVGAGMGAFRGAFVGFLLPVTDRFRLIAEHDSRRITAGVELRPIPAVSLKWMHRQDSSLLSLSWTVKF